MNKHIIYDKEGIHFSYTVVKGVKYLHCTTSVWSLSAYKKGKKLMEGFLNLCRKDGDKKVLSITPNPKFAKMFGGKTVGYIQHCEVIEWDLTL